MGDEKPTKSLKREIIGGAIAFVLGTALLYLFTPVGMVVVEIAHNVKKSLQPRTDDPFQAPNDSLDEKPSIASSNKWARGVAKRTFESLGNKNSGVMPRNFFQEVLASHSRFDDFFYSYYPSYLPLTIKSGLSSNSSEVVPSPLNDETRRSDSLYCDFLDRTGSKLLRSSCPEEDIPELRPRLDEDIYKHYLSNYGGVVFWTDCGNCDWIVKINNRYTWRLVSGVENMPDDLSTHGAAFQTLPASKRNFVTIENRNGTKYGKWTFDIMPNTTLIYKITKGN